MSSSKREVFRSFAFRSSSFVSFALSSGSRIRGAFQLIRGAERPPAVQPARRSDPGTARRTAAGQRDARLVRVHTVSAQRIGLVEAINRDLHLLKIHLPYFESDHVLNIAYNLLAGGTCLEDLERRRTDEGYLDGLGAKRTPDPTTGAGLPRIPCARPAGARWRTPGISSSRPGESMADTWRETRR